MLKYGLNTHVQRTSLETDILLDLMRVNFENLSHSPIFLLSTENFCFMSYKSCTDFVNEN